MIKVLLVDDHKLILDALSILLELEDDIKIVGKAYNGIEALDILENINADIVVLDINMPKMDGLTTAEIIKKRYPQVKIIMLTMHDDFKFIQSAISLGVHGYILKSRGKEELLSAIKVVHIGEEYFGDMITRIIINQLKNRSDMIKEVKLTKRENQVLQFIAKGLTTPEISQKLLIAPSTVETHRRNLIEKTRVDNSKGLVKYAIENGLI